MYTLTIDKKNRMEIITDNGTPILFCPLGTLYETFKNYNSRTYQWGKIPNARSLADMDYADFCDGNEDDDDYNDDDENDETCDHTSTMHEWAIQEAYKSNHTALDRLGLLVSDTDILFDWFQENAGLIKESLEACQEDYNDIDRFIRYYCDDAPYWILYDETNYSIQPQDYLDEAKTYNTKQSVLLSLLSSKMKRHQAEHRFEWSESIRTQANIPFSFDEPKSVLIYAGEIRNEYEAAYRKQIEDSTKVLKTIYAKVRSDELIRKSTYLSIADQSGVSKKGIFDYLEGANKALFSKYAVHFDSIDTDPWIAPCYSTDDINLLSCIQAFTPNNTGNSIKSFGISIALTPYSFKNAFELAKERFLIRHSEAYDKLDKLTEALQNVVDSLGSRIDMSSNLSQYTTIIYQYLCDIQVDQISDEQLADYALIALLIPGAKHCPPIFDLHYNASFQNGFRELIYSITHDSYGDPATAIYSDYCQFSKILYSSLIKLLADSYQMYIASVVKAKKNTSIFNPLKTDLKESDYKTYYFESMEFFHIIIRKAVEDNRNYLTLKRCSNCGRYFTLQSNRQKLCANCHDYYEHIGSTPVTRSYLHSTQVTAQRFISTFQKNVGKNIPNEQEFYKFGYYLKRCYAIQYFSSKHDAFKKYWAELALKDERIAKKSIDSFFSENEIKNKRGKEGKGNKNIDYKTLKLRFPVIQDKNLKYYDETNYDIKRICKVLSAFDTQERQFFEEQKRKVLEEEEEKGETYSIAEYITIAQMCERYTEFAKEDPDHIISKIVTYMIAEKESSKATTNTIQMER